MREMKDSGIEWVGEIPKNWKVTANKYVMKKIKHIQPIYQGEDILSLTINGVIVRELDAGGKMPASFDGYQRLYPGNLLMCLFDYDVTPRCIGFIKNEGLTSPAYSQFVLKNGNIAKYYYYYFLMIDSTKELLHLAKNLRHSFTEEQLGTINSPVPPITEQTHIADFLDNKCSEIDSLYSDIEKQIETLEEYKKSLITETVTKGLNPAVEMKDSGIEWIGEIPSHWEIKKLKYVSIEIASNEIMNPDISNYIGLENVESYSNQLRKTETKYEKSVQKKCHEGNVLFGKLRPYLAKVIISPFDGFCTGEFLQFSNYQGDNRFLRYSILNPKFIEKVNMSTYGAKMPRANSEFIMNLNITYPAESEQARIADFLDSKCFEIDNAIVEKREQLTTLAEYKKSLIYEYVTGKKEVM